MLPIFFKYKALLLVSAFILFIKTGITLCYPIRFEGFEDWSIAKKLVDYGIYAEILSSGPSTIKLPVYPLFLSVFYYLFGQNAFITIAIVQHILYFFIPLGIYSILKNYQLEKAGFITAYLFLFSPAYLYYSFAIEATNVFIPLCILWTWMAFKIHLKQWQNNTAYLVLGVITAVLFLTQVVVVPIVIALLLFGIILQKIHWKKTILLGFVTLLCYSPWVVRNYISFHQFIPSKSPFYHNLYVSFDESNNLFSSLKKFNAQETDSLYHYRAKVSELEMEQVFRKELEKKIKPKDYGLKALQNAFLLWYVPNKYIENSPWTFFVARKLFVILLNIVTLFAFFYWWKKNKAIVYFFLFLFVGFTFPYMIGHASNIRFKLDFEWIQFIFIALYFSTLISSNSKKSMN